MKAHENLGDRNRWTDSKACVKMRKEDDYISAAM